MFQFPKHVHPVIVGISGEALTSDERDLFKAHTPSGIILFKRNCKTPDQVRALNQEIKDVLGFDCPILIDQEGGRVSRLKEPHFKEFPVPSTFKNEKDAYDNAYAMACILKDLYINVNCTPLADLVFSNTHDVIGDRSFGDDPEYVGKMAAAVMKGHFDAGVMPIIKHIPGHGRAIVDSHKELPIVDADMDTLEKTDFKAFQIALETLKKTCSLIPWGMTAHIVYKDIDPDNCATQSTKVIREIIRQNIGFSGLLLSDCITMEALQGAYHDRAKKTLEAGCDIALHCSGKLDEMRSILK